MKIVVGVKHVPDTETKIKPGSDGRSLDETGVKWVVSPYDEYALDEALQLRDAIGSGEVVAVCAGREQAKETLRKALAMGADRAVLIQDERFERCDGVVRADALAAIVREEQAELALVGKYGVGTDDWQTGPMLAERLDWPHVGAAASIAVADGELTAQREVEGAVEHQRGALPIVVSCEKGERKPRLASLKGIMQAKKKTIETKSAADVGIDDARLDSPMLVWDAIELPPERGEVRLIEGSPQEAAATLARALREDAKVI